MIDYDNKKCPFKMDFCQKDQCAAWQIVGCGVCTRGGCVFLEGKP